ncbi:phage integrase N-terminal SAM-like domain-containing protein [Alkalicoccus urumqiensis]|uniref:Core-binding (CB) domain-containing protein n=1 Tax=Alkalicoccus urumqiensis TaxID=1548213 RepID=A0A2P6MKA9_ALKUR|nr:phage integrase N-terminal SAM-like domain-containing protein [Alkalicoccus urumqiensis]PRO66720.1 hypothetical protein C6I21_01970 [Alkalicoccus urumqiensis]
MYLTEFQRHIDDYMLYCHAKGLRPKTMHSYEQTMRLFAQWCEAEQNVSKPSAVTPELIREYMKYLQERGKYTVVADKQSEFWNYPDNRPERKQRKPRRHAGRIGFAYGRRWRRVTKQRRLAGRPF